MGRYFQLELSVTLQELLAADAASLKISSVINFLAVTTCLSNVVPLMSMQDQYLVSRSRASMHSYIVRILRLSMMTNDFR